MLHSQFDARIINGKSALQGSCTESSGQKL